MTRKPGSDMTPEENAPASEIEAYIGMTPEEIARLVLYLLAQEALEGKVGSLPEAVQNHAHRAREAGPS